MSSDSELLRRIEQRQGGWSNDDRDDMVLRFYAAKEELQVMRAFCCVVRRYCQNNGWVGSKCRIKTAEERGKIEASFIALVPTDVDLVRWAQPHAGHAWSNDERDHMIERLEEARSDLLLHKKFISVVGAFCRGNGWLGKKRYIRTAEERDMAREDAAERKESHGTKRRRETGQETRSTEPKKRWSAPTVDIVPVSREENKEEATTVKP